MPRPAWARHHGRLWTFLQALGLFLIAVVLTVTLKNGTGQMGNERVTVQNLEVIKVMPEHNLLLVKGSVPGAKGSIVTFQIAVAEIVGVDKYNVGCF